MTEEEKLETIKELSFKLSEFIFNAFDDKDTRNDVLTEVASGLIFGTVPLKDIKHSDLMKELENSLMKTTDKTLFKGVLFATGRLEKENYVAFVKKDK